jgi:hypothetical protein
MDTIRNKQRFISILRDYIPEYEKERRLLITAIENNVVDGISRGTDDMESAITKAKEFMENDMFLSKVAIDFILQVVTYMFGYDYKPTAEEPTTTAASAVVTSSEPSQEEDADGDKKGKKAKSKSKAPKSRNLIGTCSRQLDEKAPENRLFTPNDATKYRLRGTVEIPEGYTAIKGFAFDEFSLLKSVTVPEGVIAIGEYAFSNCTRLTSVSLPSTLRFLKASAFESCVKLANIELPRGVVSIEDGTFQFCESLESITIPDTVGSIGSSAFSCCDNLQTVRIPDSVKYIGDSVFEYCPVTVECYEYSYVHKYCQSAGIPYTLIKEDE